MNLNLLTSYVNGPAGERERTGGEHQGPRQERRRSSPGIKSGLSIGKYLVFDTNSQLRDEFLRIENVN